MKTLTYNHITDPFVLKMGNYNIKEDNKEHDYSKDYFTISALADGNLSFHRKGVGNFDYSLDEGETWTSTNTSDLIRVNSGQKLLLRSTDPLGRISTDFDFDVSGNVMSLMYADEFKNATELRYEDGLISLLSMSRVVNANNLILPTTTLTANCYQSMFSNCTSLVAAPELPATTLVDSCYVNMFNECTSLVNAPALPATTLADYCYTGMFNGCTSLKYIKMLAIDFSAAHCLDDFMTHVAENGTFVKNSQSNLKPADVSLPISWTMITETEEPGLPQHL